MDMIQEEGDFESDTGANGKPVQLLKRLCDVISRAKTFYQASSGVQNRCEGLKCRRWEARQDGITVVDARDDKGLCENTEAGFIQATLHLSDSANVEIAGSGNGGNVLSHVQIAV